MPESRKLAGVNRDHEHAMSRWLLHGESAQVILLFPLKQRRMSILLGARAFSVNCHFFFAEVY